MSRRISLSLLAVLALIVAVPAAQNTEKIDQDVNARIRKEGMENSQILKTMHYLTDVYGPRLTGSPNHENAAKWAIKQMESWGFKNGHLEPWDFSKVSGNGNEKVVREGWLNLKATGHIISPVKDNLVFEVLAWTPSTKGVVTAPAFNLITPQGPPPPPAPEGTGGGGGGGRGGGAPARLGPTEAELKAYFTSIAPKMKGAIVLVGAPSVPNFQETPPAKRRDDAQMKAQYNPDPNAPPAPGRPPSSCTPATTSLFAFSVSSICAALIFGRH